MRDIRDRVESSEQELEKEGDINALQWKRWLDWMAIPATIRAEFDIGGFLKAEFKLRDCAQHEITIDLRIKEAQERLLQTHSEAARDTIRCEIEILKQQAEELHHDCWFQQRKFWSQKALLNGGPLTRGMKLWRSNPNWYMHRTLNEDCAGRGGCCGRDCNCCSSRLNIPGREFAAGHCTTRCHCCEKSRGFVLSVEEIEVLDQQFDPSRPGYFGRVSYATFFGLIPENYKDSPFDLIDGIPPAYTPEALD